MKSDKIEFLDVFLHSGLLKKHHHRITPESISSSTFVLNKGQHLQVWGKSYSGKNKLLFKEFFNGQSDLVNIRYSDEDFIIAIQYIISFDSQEIKLYLSIANNKPLSSSKKSKNDQTSTSKIKKDRTLNNLIFIAGFFYTYDIRDAALGDMLEKYEINLKFVSQAKAKWWMFSDICRSNYPLVKSLMRTKLIKMLKLIGLYQIYRYFFINTIV